MKTDNLQEILTFFNPWWKISQISEKLALPFQRPIFYRLLSYLDTDRIIILKGPRRTGKSTLLFQLIEQLLHTSSQAKPLDPKSILFLSLDDPGIEASLDEILQTYTELTQKDFSKEPLYCFLDEVHFLPDWQRMVKKYYDQKYPIKFIISSSAASLLRSTSESLAGRTVEETILPFSFFEFATFKLSQEKNDSLNDQFLSEIIHVRKAKSWEALLKKNTFLPFQRKIDILWQEYLAKGGFPHLFSLEEDILRHKLLKEDIIDKAIYRDIATLFGVRDAQKLEKLFLYCVSLSGSLWNGEQASKNLGIKSREIVSKYLRYLKDSYLVFTANKFSGSTETSLRGLQKMFIIDHSFLRVFPNNKTDFGVENIIATHFFTKNSSLLYFREKGEVDIVTQINHHIVPVEVKYKEKIEWRDLHGLIAFQKKYQPKISFVITKKYFHFENNTWFIPASLFLLVEN